MIKAEQRGFRGESMTSSGLEAQVQVLWVFFLWRIRTQIDWIDDCRASFSVISGLVKVGNQ